VLHFRENDRDLPIAGTPPPKPCPFCGMTDCSIVFTEATGNGDRRSAFVQCDHCGMETGHVCKGGPASGPPDSSSYALAREAARLWNDRKGGAA
jgi:hypothetical protein